LPKQFLFAGNVLLENPHDKKAYKKRNVFERCFGRLKDFRRIATRYDKLAQNFVRHVR
jgi:transposase